VNSGPASRRWPVWRTDEAAGRAITWGQWTAALLIALLVPVPAGLLMVHVIAPLLPSAATGPVELAFLGVLLVYSPALSWVGLVPGALLLRRALRRGVGGWATALVLGLILGTVLANWLGALAWMLGTVQALIFWIALHLRAGIAAPVAA